MATICLLAAGGAQPGWHPYFRPALSGWCSSQTFGPQCGAGHRLGVEAPVERVSRIRGGSWAERETRHGCRRAVIGNVFDDREAWAAVGTVDERVQVAAVMRVEELALAVSANGYVGADGLEGACNSGRLTDFKGLMDIADLNLAHLERVDVRQRWLLVL